MSRMLERLECTDTSAANATGDDRRPALVALMEGLGGELRPGSA